MQTTATSAASEAGLQEALLQVATALNQGLGRYEVFQRIATQLGRLIPFDSLLIGRADPVARTVAPVFSTEYVEQVLAHRVPYGTGLAGYVAQTGKPLIYNRGDTDPGIPRPAQIPGTPDDSCESVMVLPLVGSDGVEGTLALYRTTAGQPAFRTSDLPLAELFATQAQVAIHNAELLAAAEGRARRLAAMNDILRSTTSASLDVTAICRSYEQALGNLLPFSVAAVSLQTSPGVLTRVWLTESVGLPLGDVLPDDSAPRWAVGHGRGYVVGDVQHDTRYGRHFGLVAGGARAVVVAPLMARGRVFGAIGIGHPTPGFYDEHSLELLEEGALQLGAALDNALLYREVLERKANQSALLAKLISAQEEERRALAADLHDDTIQSLAAALIQVDRVASADPFDSAVLLDKLRGQLYTAMGRARKLMFNLRPPVLDAEGLVPALRQQLELLRSEGVAAELDCNLEGRLNPTVEIVLFRSLQEALRNVRKHAAARHVRIELRRDPGEQSVRVVLSDDGRGFDVSAGLAKALAGGHLGLHSMLERVDLAGGTIELDSRPGEGTRLTMSIPTTLGAGAA